MIVVDAMSGAGRGTLRNAMASGNGNDDDDDDDDGNDVGNGDGDGMCVISFNFDAIFHLIPVGRVDWVG